MKKGIGGTYYYVRDAAGNVMAVYKEQPSGTVSLEETHLYGSSRLGIAMAHAQADVGISIGKDYDTAKIVIFTRGEKFFELSNHLGNVLVTVSDKRLQYSSNGTVVSHYQADVTSANDYYPFGMLMPGRKFSSDKYGFGFNGMLKSKDCDCGDNYTTLNRELDTRIGHWWSIDPVTDPTMSPYSSMDNNPILNSDPNGDCATCPKIAKTGDRHTEKDVGGTTPLGGFVFAGKDANLNYINIGDNKNPNWVIQSFTNKGGESYSWSIDKKWYVNKTGNEYDQAPWHDIMDWAQKQFGKPMSEAAKNAIEGEPLKDTKEAFNQYQANGGSGGIPGFIFTGLKSSLSQWGSDLTSGGHRSGQALIGAWQFSADISLSSGLTTTKSFDLLSIKNGYGPFGKQGFRLGSYRIDMLYRNPASGFGHGTLFSIKELKSGGNKLRWEYGNLHSGGIGWHSTFRFNIKNVQYGSSAQRGWSAPFQFWNYKIKMP